MTSPLFPPREMIRAAARLSVLVDHARASGAQVVPGALRALAAAEARYARLPPHEQQMVAQAFNEDREYMSLATEQAHQEDEASRYMQEVNQLSQQLTPGMAGRGHGVGLELGSALRNNASVTVRAKKLPTGAEADARIARATGMTAKEYEAALDRAVEVRNKHRYGDWDQWRQYVAKNFPNQDFSAVNKLVRDWPMESLGLEMQRRAQASQPDTVTLKATDEDRRRLDLIEAVSEVEGSNNKSIFHRGHTERLREIVEEGKDRPGDLGLRASIAQAFLDHGATFEVNTGGFGEGADGERITEEIVSVSDEE